jgi:sodium/bile acid cotransporter 7
MLARLFPDRFVLILLATIAAASVFPVEGEVTATAQHVATAAVVLLFFLNGVRLPRAQVIAAMRDMRLMGAALFFCFAAMPLVGLGLQWASAPFLPPLIALGFLYCGILPSTVQSATAATSLAQGDVAASVVMAAVINLVGVLAAPLLFALLGGSAVSISGAAALRIVLILLLPFIAGQLLQRMLRPTIAGHPALVRTLDRSAIAIAVYVAFSGAVVSGLWDHLSGSDVAIITMGILVLLTLGYGGAWLLGGLLRLALPQRVSLFFAGAQKSIAVGAPLAATLFPPATAGMVLVVVLGYHMAQLMVAAWLAAWLAQKGTGVIVE